MASKIRSIVQHLRHLKTENNPRTGILNLGPRRDEESEGILSKKAEGDVEVEVEEQVGAIGPLGHRSQEESHVRRRRGGGGGVI